MRTTCAVLVLLLATVSCATGEPPEERTAEEPTSSTSEPTTEEPLPCVPEQGPFTGPAAEEFGAERVMSAYCLLADLALEQEDTSLAFPIPRQKPQDVNRLKAILTSDAARGWGQLVQTRRINGLTLHDVSELPAGYVVPDDSPWVYDTQVGPATAEVVRGGTALALVFTLDTNVVLEEPDNRAGRHSLLPVSRQATYVLVPDGDGWLVDDWQASFTHGRVRLAIG